MSEQLNDKEKAFLQMMMRYSCITKDQGLDMAIKLELVITEKDLDLLIRKINKQIKEFRFELRRFTDEENATNYLVFINLVDNSISRLSTLYTKNHMEYFKKIVSSIVTSPCGYVSYNQTLNLVNNLTENNVKIKISEADELLKLWTKEKYLAYKKDQFNICLGIRSLTELDTYLADNFPNNVSGCDLCKSICIQGINCSHLGVKLHSHCAGKYFSNIKDCSICNC